MLLLRENFIGAYRDDNDDWVFTTKGSRALAAARARGSLFFFSFQPGRGGSARPRRGGALFRRIFFGIGPGTGSAGFAFRPWLPKFFKKWHSVVALNPCVREIDVSRNELGDAGVQAFGAALGHNSNLRELRISHNWIQDLAAAALADGLCRNASLRVLDVRNCDIGRHGVSFVADALHSNMALTRLGLENNALGASGAVALSTMLCHNRWLRVLNLEGTEVRDEGATAIGMALSAHGTLARLDLSKNIIGRASKNIIGRACAQTCV